MKQERLEKQKKRDHERRKRASSNAGSLKAKGADSKLYYFLCIIMIY
jgi:hypothetical protein